MPRRYEVLLLGRVMAVISDRGSAAQSKPGDYSRSGSHTRPSQTFLVAVTSICDLSQLAKQTSLHVECKHSYFFINLISGVCSAAESYVKIKHCFQKFFFFPSGYFCQCLVRPVELHIPIFRYFIVNRTENIH